MDGRAFLEVARVLATTSGEAYWRSAVGRAYYAVLHEGRAALERWGFPLPPKTDLHKFVRFRFSVPADADLKQIGDILSLLSLWRNKCDYHLSVTGPQGKPRQAQDAVANAAKAIDLMDQLDTDPARRAVAVAAIRAAFVP